MNRHGIGHAIKTGQLDRRAVVQLRKLKRKLERMGYLATITADSLGRLVVVMDDLSGQWREHLRRTTMGGPERSE